MYILEYYSLDKIDFYFVTVCIYIYTCVGGQDSFFKAHMRPKVSAYIYVCKELFSFKY